MMRFNRHDVISLIAIAIAGAFLFWASEYFKP